MSGAKISEFIVRAAAEAGNMTLLLFLAAFHPTDLTIVVEAAAKGGHRDIVEQILARAVEVVQPKDMARFHNRVLCGAAEGGQLAMLEYAISTLAATDFNHALFVAVDHEQLEVIPVLAPKVSPGKLDWHLIASAHAGKLELVKVLVKIGAQAYEDAYTEAHLKNHLEVFEFLRQCEADSKSKGT